MLVHQVTFNVTQVTFNVTVMHDIRTAAARVQKSTSVLPVTLIGPDNPP